MALLPTLLLLPLVVGQQAQRAPALAQTQLTAKADGTKELRLGYMPMRALLSETKPEGITKEPTYAGKPRYAVISVGSGPKAAHVLAVDEPEGGEFKFYFDANGNGDLTDDGDGKWSKKTEQQGRTLYGTNSMVAKATYAGRNGQETTADYGLAFYRLSTLPDSVLYYREGARIGELKVGEKTYKVALVENDGDGLYNKRIDDSGKPVNMRGEPLADKKTQNPVWLILDAGDGKKQQLDARGPFELDGKVYEARINASGERLSLVASDRKPYKPAAPVYFDPRLKPGAEPFKLVGTDLSGKEVSYEDYKGKVLLVDFWATWCGPCIAELPNVQAAYAKYHDQGFEILGISLDREGDRDKLVKFITDKSMPWKQIYDGKFWEAANAKSYGVRAIPFTLLIGKDGKIAAVGARGEKLAPAIEEALKK